MSDITDNKENYSAVQSENHADERNVEGEEKSGKKTIPWVIIISGAFLILALFGLSYFLIKKWEGSSEFHIDTSIDTGTETDDRVVLIPADLFRQDDDGVTTILVFGNDTFGDSANGPSIVKLLQENSTATIYDCTFPGSYMCTMTSGGPGESGHPIDWFCLYWLWECTKNGNLSDQERVIDSIAGIDKELYREHLATLKSIDLNTVDYMLICYDAHDYLKGHPYIKQGDEYNPMCVNGVLYGMYEKVTGNYPGMQIAVVSPAYCYAVDKTGKKRGGNFVKIDGQTLTDMILFMKVKTGEFGISYVDDYFGVKINEETADTYLTKDNVVPNLEGKKLIAAHVLNKVIRRVEVKK